MVPSIPNYLKTFAEGDFYIQSDASLIKDLIENIRIQYSIADIANKLNVSSRLVYHYLTNKRYISIKNLIILISLQNELSLADFHVNFNSISTRGHAGDYLPKKYSDELAYLSGIIAGDGHVSKRTEVRIWNESKELLEIYVIPMIKKLFRYNPHIRNYDTYFGIDIISKPINVFFKSIIGIPSGKKKGRLRVPEFIYLKDSFKINFLRGIFDTDGGITISKGKIFSLLISSSTRPFLEELKSILESLSIHIGGPYTSGSRRGYELRTFKKSEMNKFKNLIGSFHPRKIERFKRLGSSVGRAVDKIAEPRN